ncbi:MAG TPA: ABC transporter permease [Vicinamibacteria bacterium]|nr:ABC transporter permease [Vicinamibacteria bacterium]
MRRFFAALHRRPVLAFVLLMAPPLLWLGGVYLGSLGALLVQSFFHLDGFSGRVIRQPTLATWRALLTRPHLDIVLRTLVMASAVTLAAAALAFPLAYYMARYATSRMRAFLTLAVVMPLWSSYLVRVYFWKLILAKEGVVSWVFARVGLSDALDALLALPHIGGPSLSISPFGTFIAFLYVWLPYMVLPIAASLERIPRSLLEASADLGARPFDTFARVVWPLALPGVAAGSVFTFSLTLGDFVVPGTLGDSSLYLGQAVLAYQGTAGNIPLAAAFTVIPVVVMALYLAAARRAGAFDAL